MIAGPNGAGKSTFYERHLSGFKLPFINADRIALEVFGNQIPETAIESAKIAAARRGELMSEARSFIFETVLSDPQGAKVGVLAKAKEAGYFIDVHFIGIASVALSQARVVQRVEAGGHDVPDQKLSGGFPRVMENLRRLIPIASRLTIYDNSQSARPHRPVACFEEGRLVCLSAEIPVWLGFLDLPSFVNPQTFIPD